MGLAMTRAEKMKQNKITFFRQGEVHILSRTLGNVMAMTNVKNEKR